MSQTPKWLEKAVFYEIYPQSFLDTNGDGIGDLEGIRRKLDYIKDLGFNALWINPIFESTFFDAGYDVSDYKKVAKRYGGNKALTKLVASAKEKGIRILLDLVPGHTSITHKWFKETQKAKQNEYTDRFIWNKNLWEQDPDNRWIMGFSEREGSCMVNFFSIQPKLNYGFDIIKHPEYEETIDGEGPRKTREAMIDVIEYYLAQGIDGFRIDMAGWLVARDPSGEGTVKTWQRIFPKIKQDYPESAFVSEWNRPEQSTRSGFDMDFLLQDEFNKFNGLASRLDHPFFRWGEKDTNPKGFFEYFQNNYEAVKKNKGYMSMISGNHDTRRISAWLKPEELKRYYAFMLTLPNVPFFYYGDEIAMKFEANIPSVEGGFQRTGSRSPMQWTTGENAGFSKNKKTYIKVNKDRKGRTVEEQEKDPNSLLNELKALLRLKSEHTALDNNAEYKLIKDGSDGLIAYEREKGGEKLLCLFNISEGELSYGVDGKLLHSIGKTSIKDGDVKLAAHSVAILSIWHR